MSAPPRGLERRAGASYTAGVSEIAGISPVGSPLVGIIMGSTSDWPTMMGVAGGLGGVGIAFEVGVVSANGTRDLLGEYAKSAAGGGLLVIVAGGGGAAHLPGMTAAHTVVPVIGLPVRSQAL